MHGGAPVQVCLLVSVLVKQRIPDFETAHTGRNNTYTVNDGSREDLSLAPPASQSSAPGAQDSEGLRVSPVHSGGSLLLKQVLSPSQPETLLRPPGGCASGLREPELTGGEEEERSVCRKRWRPRHRPRRPVWDKCTRMPFQPEERQGHGTGTLPTRGQGLGGL